MLLPPREQWHRWGLRGCTVVRPACFQARSRGDTLYLFIGLICASGSLLRAERANLLEDNPACRLVGAHVMLATSSYYYVTCAYLAMSAGGAPLQACTQCAKGDLLLLLRLTPVSFLHGRRCKRITYATTDFRTDIEGDYRPGPSMCLGAHYFIG
jgi:hypothetical protein